jgi:ABC-type glutathione transport system ATPase component
LGLSRGDIEKRFDKIIDFAGLREFVDQKLKNFSSGMQVRLAFSVAIQAKADILLMDEVLAVGDAEFQEKCFDVFARYKRQGKTVVLVTHDMSAVENYCDRALLFDHGRLIADGSSGDVTMQYRHRVGQALNSEPIVAGDDDGEPRRWGTREVTITNVCILNQEGRPATAVPSGSCISVEIEFEAKSDVGEIVCGVALHRADGLHIAGSNTKLGGIEVPSPHAGMRDRVRYTVDKLNVNAGSYLLSASVYDRHSQHAYDEIPLAYPLRITEDVTSHGVIDLQGRWSRG